MAASHPIATAAPAALWTLRRANNNKTLFPPGLSWASYARSACRAGTAVPPSAARCFSFPPSSPTQRGAARQVPSPSRCFTRRPLAPASSTTITTAATTIQARRYHSADHPAPPGPFSPTENAVLAAAYAHVPEHGFTHRALALGARDAGYPEVTATAVPGGAFALVRWHLLTRRELLESRAGELFGGPDGVPAPSSSSSASYTADVNERAERLTWERLLANGPVIGRWQEALAIMAQPSCAPESLKELARLADDIWFLAGDAAVDPSWYAKRAALSATYAASELFMTNDRSEGFRETREFLRRRFAESAEVGGALRSVGQWVGFTARAGVNVLRSKGARI